MDKLKHIIIHVVIFIGGFGIGWHGMSFLFGA